MVVIIIAYNLQDIAGMMTHVEDHDEWWKTNDKIYVPMLPIPKT